MLWAITSAILKIVPPWYVHGTLRCRYTCLNNNCLPSSLLNDKGRVKLFYDLSGVQVLDLRRHLPSASAGIICLFVFLFSSNNSDLGSAFKHILKQRTKQQQLHYEDMIFLDSHWCFFFPLEPWISLRTNLIRLFVLSSGWFFSSDGGVPRSQRTR